MCRILVAYGRLGILKEHYPGLIRGLIGASYYDPYQVRAFGPGKHSHGDGWGRVILAIGSGKIAISYYRSLSPIYIDRPQARPPGILEEVSNPLVIDVLHARASSRGMPVNILSVQPFEYHTRSGARLFLIHNGSVDKEKLVGQLEGNYGGLERYSDSYVMGLWLAERLGDELDKDLVKELKRYTRTALNIALVLIAPSRVELIVGGYYRENLSLERKEYYRLYAAELGEEKGIIVTSSTIAGFEEYRPSSIRSWKELENGTYYHIFVEMRRDNEPEHRMTMFTI
ncbi:MAG: hypothetical protein ABWW69_00440 [Pyrodictiaceae archaeon]